MTKADFIKVMIGAGTLLCNSTLCFSDESGIPDDVKKVKIKEVRKDFLVPNSPAFTVLGISPEEIVSPTTPKEFGASLLNGLDSHGNLQTGVALDFAPYSIFAGNSLTLYQYNNNLMTRLLTRTQLSFAITKGSEEEDKARRMAIGLRLAIVDDADPRTDQELFDCYDDDEDLEGQYKEWDEIESFISGIIDSLEVLINTPNKKEARTLLKQSYSIIAQRNQEFGGFFEPVLPLNNTIPSQDVSILTEQKKLFITLLKEVEKEEDKVFAKRSAYQRETWEKCNAAAGERHWNATNITVGVAYTTSSDTGNVSDLKGDGIALYLTAGYGFDGVGILEENAHLIAHVSYRTNELVPDPDLVGGYIEQDTLVLGTQLRIAGPDIGEIVGGKDLAFHFEYDYKHANRENGADIGTHKWSLGMDVKIAENTSLNLAFGDETGKDFESDGTFIISNIKWSF